MSINDGEPLLAPMAQEPQVTQHPATHTIALTPSNTYPRTPFHTPPHALSSILSPSHPPIPSHAQLHIDTVAGQLGRLRRPVTLHVFHCPRLLPLAMAGGGEGDGMGYGQGIVLPLSDEEARLFLRGATHPSYPTHPPVNNGKGSIASTSASAAVAQASVFPPPRAPTSPRPTGGSIGAGTSATSTGDRGGGWGSSSSSTNNNQHNQQQSNEGTTSPLFKFLIIFFFFF